MGQQMTRRERIIADLTARPHTNWRDVELLHRRTQVQELQEENGLLKAELEALKAEERLEPRAAR